MRPRSEEDAHVAREAFAAAARTVVRGLPPSLCAGPLIAALVTGQAFAPRSIPWLIAVFASSLAAHLTPALAVRRHGRRGERLAHASAVVATMWCGAMYGAAPTLADRSSSSALTIALLCVAVVLYANAIFTAAAPTLAVAYHVGAVAVAVPTIVVRAENQAILLVGSIVVVIASAVNVHGLWSTVTTSIRLSRRNQLLAGELTASNDELTAALRTIELMASTDELTGVSNRRAFLAALDQLLADGRAFVLAVVDADHFKQVNDSLGHATGDAVLVAIARTISEELRPDDLIGRLGGEEFGIALPDVGLEVAASLLDQVRHAVAQTAAAGAAVTISIGAAASAPGITRSELLSRSDDALYVAKRAGRNRVETVETAHERATG